VRPADGYYRVPKRDLVTGLRMADCKAFVGDPRVTAPYAHVVEMARKGPARFIPVKVR